MPLQTSKSRARLSPKKRAAAVRHDSLDGHDTMFLQRDAVLSNFDTEIRARRQLIEQQLVYAIADLHRGCETEMSALPAVVSDMTVGCFADVYGFNIDAAVRGVARQQTEEQRSREPVNERLERGILASAKKRKHAEALPTPALSQGDPGSPLPSRPAKRTAPSATSTAALTARGIQSSRTPRNRPASPPSTSGHQGFVYRARPSLLGTSRANALPHKASTAPQTPMSAKERHPRQNESIRAFSLNGSPLGLLDVERDGDQPQRAAPAGDFTFAMPEAVVAKWKTQLDTVIMAPADRAKLERMLNDLV